MSKLNEQNWPQLDFLINNFFEIVEYKRGRGIYGDRIILKRYKNPESVFGTPTKLCDFYYLDANAVKELPMTINLRIQNIVKMVTSPENMNILCNFEVQEGVEPTEWAISTQKELEQAKTLDFKVLNDILIERYKLLDGGFISKLNKHRQKQYFLAGSSGFDLISTAYADQQINRL